MLHALKGLNFGKSRMENLIKEEITDLMEYFEKTAGKPTEVGSNLTSSASSNIAALLFGKRLKYDDPKRVMLNSCLQEANKLYSQTSWLLFYPWVVKVMKFLHVGDVGGLFRVYDSMKEYVSIQIKEHEETLNETNIRDFIDGYLVEIHKRNDSAFCKPVLEDTAVGLLSAGSETVRLTLDWLMLTMAAYPDVQEKIQFEIDKVIPRGTLPAWRDRKKLPYIEATIMELMRWRTIIPLNILRYTLEDVEFHGYFIPKHAFVLSNLWAIHHNPQYWGEDAEKFRPERFLTEDGLRIKKSEYFIPFSIGQRSCPAVPLARMEIFLYFTSFLQKFNISLPEGETPDFDGELGIGLAPKPQKLILRKRN
ncbi:cytochrome P450 2J2-like isoform X2 [Stegodyphus dumicola]|uniref:cytochrome P450 2J2-like isoform X2 n=1 Tax=Stegodyphus dumicola TaxID=202533 RepID=UPI0015AFF680|nr:cytochrome P450 2J2-like isoform X2 [Stegodyphus dumicola]XP_035232471.1 cytochrome P450 2J2-like isoform X2 [Stegodyphus dumicola]